MTNDEPALARVPLTADHRELLRRLAELVARFDPVTDTRRFVLEAQVQAANLPEHVRRALLRFRRFGDATGGLLISGLPVAPVPPTPCKTDLGVGVHLPAAAVMSLAVAALGDQFGFAQELAGHIVQDIIPVTGFEHTQQSTSSRTLLKLHTETAFTDHRADFIGLLCLRADPTGKSGTLLTSATRVMPLLGDETLRILREPRFATTVDESFLRGAGFPGPISIGPISVVAGSDQCPQLRCDFAETRGLDNEADAALAAFHQAATETASQVKLQSGDLLIMDNHSALHGRSPFAPQYNESDRWLMRTFVTRDLTRSSTERPGDGQVVHADYRHMRRV